MNTIKKTAWLFVLLMLAAFSQGAWSSVVGEWTMTATPEITLKLNGQTLDASSFAEDIQGKIGFGASPKNVTLTLEELIPLDNVVVGKWTQNNKGVFTVTVPAKVIKQASEQAKVLVQQLGLTLKSFSIIQLSIKGQERTDGTLAGAIKVKLKAKLSAQGQTLSLNATVNAPFTGTRIDEMTTFMAMPPERGPRDYWLPRIIEEMALDALENRTEE